MHFYIKTTRIDLGFPFAASAAVILMLDKSETALLVFLCCALHEAGHILLLTLCSAPPDAIILGVFGMRIERGELCLSAPSRDLRRILLFRLPLCRLRECIPML